MSLRQTVAAVLLAALALPGCASTAVESPDAVEARAPTETPAAVLADKAYDGLAPARATTELPTMAVAQLPPEGIETLRIIAADGPFPYPQDGATFQNRERILPSKPRGFYEEYTVITPGEDDRGARRIVAADDGGRFYTDDHYDSFTEVVSG